MELPNLQGPEKAIHVGVKNAGKLPTKIGKFESILNPVTSVHILIMPENQISTFESMEIISIFCLRIENYSFKIPKRI